MADMVNKPVDISDEKSTKLNQKRTQVSEKLDKRHEIRIADAQKRRDVKDSEASKKETVAFFNESFKREKSDIVSMLEKCESLTKLELTNQFDKIAKTIQNLQKFISESTVFLPVYEVRAAQDCLSKIQAAVNEKRDVLIPKKKFAFRGKTKKSEPLSVVETNKDQPDGVKESINYELFECNFVNVSGEKLEKNEIALNNKDVALSNLDNCTVRLIGSPSAMHVNWLKNCVVLCGPISGSIMVHDCINCTFVLACQQLRIHTTTDSKFYIHVTSRAIIEDCKKVEFATYNFEYDKVNEHYSLSGLDKNRNNWNDIDDFNWLASDSPSPNWKLMTEIDQKKIWN